MEEHDTKFNAEIVDTFCFRWPAFRCYVLVRVLDTSIALFPVQSRRAFLYFHHAPLPRPPGPARPPLKRDESRVQSMFQSWMHALALTDSLNEDSGDRSDSTAEEEYVPYRERNSSVTLADVMNELYPRLKHAWIHAPCDARADNQNQTTLILESPHNVLLLKARSHAERQTFLNLVNLQSLMHKKVGGSSIYSHSNSSGTGLHLHKTRSMFVLQRSANQLIRFYLNESRHVYKCIRQLGQQIKQDEAKVRSYCELFEKLGSDWDRLASSVNSFVLSDDGSQEQLRNTIESQLRKTLYGYTQLSNRMDLLHERIQANPDAVGAVRSRLMRSRMKYKPKRPWVSPFIGLIFLFIIFGALYALRIA